MLVKGTLHHQVVDEIKRGKMRECFLNAHQLVTGRKIFGIVRAL